MVQLPHIYLVTVLAAFTHPAFAATTVNGCCSRDDPVYRTICPTGGTPGWTQEQCEAVGCCYDDTEKGSIFCFKDDCPVIRNNNSPDYGDFGNWGAFGNWSHCPQGSFGVGIQTKLETPNGADDTALNGIRLLCKYPSTSAKLNYNSVAQSAEGNFGVWGKLVKCPTKSWMYGFDLKVEEKQYGGDDTAANSIRIWCTGTPGYFEDERYNWDWGFWTGRQTCPNHYTICAIRTQVEPPQWTGVDDTALNNVEFKCCQ